MKLEISVRIEHYEAITVEVEPGEDLYEAVNRTAATQHKAFAQEYEISGIKTLEPLVSPQEAYIVYLADRDDGPGIDCQVHAASYHEAGAQAYALAGDLIRVDSSTVVKLEE